MRSGLAIAPQNDHVAVYAASVCFLRRIEMDDDVLWHRHTQAAPAHTHTQNNILIYGEWHGRFCVVVRACECVCVGAPAPVVSILSVIFL